MRCWWDQSSRDKGCSWQPFERADRRRQELVRDAVLAGTRGLRRACVACAWWAGASSPMRGSGPREPGTAVGWLLAAHQPAWDSSPLTTLGGAWIRRSRDVLTSRGRNTLWGSSPPTPGLDVYRPTSRIFSKSLYPSGGDTSIPDVFGFPYPPKGCASVWGMSLFRVSIELGTGGIGGLGC